MLRSLTLLLIGRGIGLERLRSIMPYSVNSELASAAILLCCTDYDEEIRQMPNYVSFNEDGVLEDEDGGIVTCSWFALCAHSASDIREHPVLGGVPICERCTAKAERL